MRISFNLRVWSLMKIGIFGILISLMIYIYLFNFIIILALSTVFLILAFFADVFIIFRSKEEIFENIHKVCMLLNLKMVRTHNDCMELERYPIKVKIISIGLFS